MWPHAQTSERICRWISAIAERWKRGCRRGECGMRTLNAKKLWRVTCAWAIVLGVGANIISWTSADGDPSIAAASQRIAVPGIANFARVNEHLYRGAQPDSRGYAKLKSIGIDTVVKLDGEAQPTEQQAVAGLRMRFLNLPWSANREPSREQVLAFLTLVHDNPGNHIFVHCRAGADRTGVMVALYRIQFEHWSPARAVAEMKLYHYHPSFLPGLRQYVDAFPSLISSDPALRNLSQRTSAIH